jgi:hypothetical protein
MSSQLSPVDKLTPAVTRHNKPPALNLQARDSTNLLPLNYVDTEPSVIVQVDFDLNTMHVMC